MQMQSLKVNAHTEYLHSITQFVTKSLLISDSLDEQVSSDGKVTEEKETDVTVSNEQDGTCRAGNSYNMTLNSCNFPVRDNLLRNSSLNSILGGAYWTLGSLSLLHANSISQNEFKKNQAENKSISVATNLSAPADLVICEIQQPNASGLKYTNDDIGVDKTVKSYYENAEIPMEFKLLEIALQDSLLALLHCLQLYILIPTSLEFLVNFEHRLNFIKYSIILPLQQSDSGAFRDLPNSSQSQVEGDVRLNLAALQCILLIDGLLIKVKEFRLRKLDFKFSQHVSSIDTHKPFVNARNDFDHQSLFLQKACNENLKTKTKTFSIGLCSNFNSASDNHSKPCYSDSDSLYAPYIPQSSHIHNFVKGSSFSAHENLFSQLHFPEMLVSWILKCQNCDGGFGGSPGNESHAGLTFCSISCLRLLGKLSALKQINRRRLIRWLSERQTTNGGMNGRPGKSADVCYSFWVTATLAILGVSLSSVIRIPSLIDYIFKCQHDAGGFSRIPPVNQHGQQKFSTKNVVKAKLFDALSKPSIEENTSETEVDPFHTFFALAALALLAHAVSNSDNYQKCTHGEFPSQLIGYNCSSCETIKNPTPQIQHLFQMSLARQNLLNLHSSYSEASEGENFADQSFMSTALFPSVNFSKIVLDLRFQLQQLHPVFALPVCHISDVFFPLETIL